MEEKWRGGGDTVVWCGVVGGREEWKGKEEEKGEFGKVMVVVVLVNGRSWRFFVKS